MILGMDQLYQAIECLDDNGEERLFQGKKKATLVKMVKVMEVKYGCRKWCALFVAHIFSDRIKDVEDAEVMKRYLILQQFHDAFLEEIIEIPLHREEELSIELVPRAMPTSKAPYMMRTLQLVELNLQLKEMLYKGYISPTL